MKLLAYTIGGQKIGVDILSWNNDMLSGNTAFIAIADTGSTPSNYTNISSVENWDAFGSSALNITGIKAEIIKLIPGTPTADQYSILANYMNVGINSMTKIGTNTMLGSISTSTTALTGITDTKYGITGGTVVGDLKITGGFSGIGGILYLDGDMVVGRQIGGNLTVSGNTTVSGNMTVRGRITNPVVSNAVTGATNLGSGSGLYTSTSASKLQLKSLKAGTNVTLASTSTGVTISAGYDDYLYAECTTNRTTTSTTCIKAQGLTGSTSAGKYQVDFNTEVGNATAAGCTFVAFKVDNTTWGSNYQYKAAVTSTVQAISINMSRDITLTAASHCFDVWYWNSGGTACIPMNSIRVKRIC